MKFLIFTLLIFLSPVTNSGGTIHTDIILNRMKKDANKRFEIALAHQKQGEETEKEKAHRSDICVALKNSEDCLNSASDGKEGRACVKKWGRSIINLQNKPIKVKASFSEDIREGFNNELESCREKGDHFDTFITCVKGTLIKSNQLLQDVYYCTDFDSFLIRKLKEFNFTF